MKIAVFLGAGFGNTSYWRQFTEETGTWIGKNGHTLIYGGSKTGLMGVLADAVLKEKGEVIGVETQDFIRLDVQHPALTKLIIAKDMAERKQIMIENADAYIAVPGGFGTLDEITEALNETKLHGGRKPVIFLNGQGYYDALAGFFVHMEECGFIPAAWKEFVHFVSDVSQLDSVLKRKDRL